MEFEWDEAKSERNRIERGLPFDLAMELFNGWTVDQADRRRDCGERRMRTIGLAGGQVLVCVRTDRGSVRRVISLRPANRKERDGYHTTLAG